MEDINLRIQDVQQKVNSERFKLRHIIGKLSKATGKENPKCSKRKMTRKYKDY